MSWTESPRLMSVADFNNDGKPDITHGENLGTGYLHLNERSGGVVEFSHLEMGSVGPAFSSCPVDIDEDGDVDLLINYSEYFVCLNDLPQDVSTKTNNFYQVDVEIFPIPSSTFVTINEELTCDMKIGFYDEHGKLLKKEELLGKTILDIRALPIGPVFMTLSNSKISYKA